MEHQITPWQAYADSKNLGQRKSISYLKQSAQKFTTCLASLQRNSNFIEQKEKRKNKKESKKMLLTETLFQFRNKLKGMKNLSNEKNEENLLQTQQNKIQIRKSSSKYIALLPQLEYCKTKSNFKPFIMEAFNFSRRYSSPQLKQQKDAPFLRTSKHSTLIQLSKGKIKTKTNGIKRYNLFR